MDGLQVGVTGARKGRELADALRRHGAAVVEGPTLRTAPPRSDATLAAATDAVLASKLAWVVASTGAGMTAWVAAAEARGRGDVLRAVLRRTPAVARSPKAAGGLRRLDVTPRFVSPQETDADVDLWLAERVGPGDVVAAQVHGDAEAGTYPAVASVAHVLTVAPYRCALPLDPGPAHDLVRRAVGRPRRRGRHQPPRRPQPVHAGRGDRPT